MPSSTTAAEEPRPAPADTQTNTDRGDSPVDTNGFPRNGGSSFSLKTVEAVRLATESFFREILHKTPQEAREKARLLTSNWEEDLELSRK
jgi:hypothetical protein